MSPELEKFKIGLGDFVPFLMKRYFLNGMPRISVDNIRHEDAKFIYNLIAFNFTYPYQVQLLYDWLGLDSGWLWKQPFSTSSWHEFLRTYSTYNKQYTLLYKILLDLRQLTEN